MTFINAYIKKWTKIAASSNGQIIVAIGDTGLIYKSSDSGTTWTPLETAGTREWANITINNNGSVIAASTTSSHIFLSEDGGSTWQQKIIYNENIKYQYIGSLYITGDGTKIFATASSYPISNIDGTSSFIFVHSFMFVSQDMGLTWNKVLNNRIRSFTGENNFAVSNNGLIILCMDYNTSSILISTNGGTSFQTYDSGIYFDRFSISNNLLVAASSSSSELYVSTDNGNLFVARSTLPSLLNLSDIVTKGSTIVTKSHVSTNGGITWTAHSKIFDNIIVLQNNFMTLYTSTNADNSLTLFTGKWSYNNYIITYSELYTSIDGINWNLISTIKNNLNFNKIAISEIGSHIVLSSTDTIYVSTNGGSSWNSSYLNVSNHVFFRILDIAVNANGDTIAAIVYQNKTMSVMISHDYGSNWTTTTLISDIQLFPSSASHFNMAMSDDGYIIYISYSALIGDVNFSPTWNTRTVETYKSIDRGISWSIIKSWPGAVFSTWNFSNMSIGGAIKISSEGSRILMFAQAMHPTSNVTLDVQLLSTDSGQNWSLTRTNGSLFNSLLTMSNNGLVCYKIDTGYPAYRLFKSTDGGINWSLVYTLSSAIPQSIATNGNGSTLLISYTGVLYLSYDGGQTFRNIILNLPTTNIDIRNIQFENAIISHTNLKGITYDIHGNVYRNIPCTGV